MTLSMCLLAAHTVLFSSDSAKTDAMTKRRTHHELLIAALSVAIFWPMFRCQINLPVATILESIDLPQRAYGACVGSALNSLFAALTGIVIIYITAHLYRFKRTLAVFLTFMLVFECSYGLASFTSNEVSILGLGERVTTNFVTGTFANRNLFAFFIAITTPIALTTTLKTNRLPKSVRVTTSIALILFTAVTITGTGSRLGLLAWVVGVAIWSINQLIASETQNRLKLLSLFLLVAIGTITAILWFGASPIVNRFLSLTNNIPRLPVWNTLNQIEPLGWVAGIGMGEFEHVFRIIAPPGLEHDYIYLHNDPLQFVLEMGIVPAATIFFLIATWILKNRRAYSMTPTNWACVSGIVAGGVHSLGDFPLSIPGTGFTYCLVIGMVFQSPKRRSTSSTGQRHLRSR